MICGCEDSQYRLRNSRNHGKWCCWGRITWCHCPQQFNSAFWFPQSTSGASRATHAALSRSTTQSGANSEEATLAIQVIHLAHTHWSAGLGHNTSALPRPGPYVLSILPGLLALPLPVLVVTTTGLAWGDNNSSMACAWWRYAVWL
jgi:hypothetical protein